jgi:hypothetical protein
MPRYKLRTMLILLAVGPPVLGGAWLCYREYWKQQESQGYSFEWGGPFPLDDLQPIESDELEEAIRDAITP